MPPKGGKQSPEEKEKAFVVFKESDEYKQYYKIQEAKDETLEIQKAENSTEDISADWTKFLHELYRFKEICKIPGKAKNYDQAVVRTMFYARLKDNALEIQFDGVKYPVTSASNLDHWNCRSFLMQEMYPKIERNDMEDLIQASNYQNYKKDFAKMMKEWDKRYEKHRKSANPELAAIQKAVALPLTNLFESNFNFFCLNRLIAKGEPCPDFRYKALEDKFIEHMNKVCDLFMIFGKLKDEVADMKYKDQFSRFQIKQMLAVLKTDNWENIAPFNFYFKPLRDATDAMIACVNAMRKAGPLRCKYIMENNTELMELTIKMVAADVIAQWVGADELKRDQLNFLYTVMKRMFDSPLREILVDQKHMHHKNCIENVFPEYLAYHANKRHCIIDTRKEHDRLHHIEKCLRSGKDPNEVIEEPEEEEVKKAVHKLPPGKKVEIVEELPPRPTDEDEKQMKEYGRYYMMRNYFLEDEVHMLMWHEGSVRIGRINEAVLTDLDDFILLQAFKGEKATEIRKKVDLYLETQRKRELMHLKVKKQEGNPLEEGKIEDKKRDFMRNYRPDMKYPVWNFNEDEPESKTPHVLRENADPKEPYRDDNEQRVDKTIINIQELAQHLKSHEKENWDLLVGYVLQIFIEQEKAEAAEYAAWEETQ